MKLSCKFMEDGSFSICEGEKALLENCFPGIDRAPVKPIQVEVCPDGTGAKWHLRDGVLEISAGADEQGNLRLSCHLSGWTRPVGTLWILYRAEAAGAVGCYQAARGIGGDTGYVSLERLRRQRRIQSFGLGSLRYSDGVGSLVFFADRHDHYETVCALETESVIQAPQPSFGVGAGEKEDYLTLSVGCKLENTNGEAVENLPSLVFRMTDRIEEGLEYAAEQIGKTMGARLSMSPAYHWCSWYYCYNNFDLPQLKEYLEGFTKMEPRVPVKYFQIDAGYCTSLGDWLIPNERYPGGLQEAFELIQKAGYLPGIWVGPFMVGNRSRLFAEHPDWILHDLEDQPVRCLIMDNEPKLWGYQDEEYYVLDTSHPDAMAYMKDVFETLHRWGVRMFKTDFMLWGLQDSSQVKRHTPGKTSVEYFREFLEMIRGAIGEESYWLGCIAPFLSFVGYADAMRIGDDVGSSWEGTFGPQNMIRSLIGNNYSNHRYYQIDPDAVMLRNFQIRLSQTEIESLAMLAAISGGCIYTSDPLHQIGEERVRLFRFIQPDRRRKPFLPYLEQERREAVMVHQNPENHRGLIFLFNPSDEAVKEQYSLKDLGFTGGETVTEYSEGKEYPVVDQAFWAVTQPHGYRLFILSQEKGIQIDRNSLWKNLEN